MLHDVFSAALNFMERERRRYYRQPVKMPVRLVLDEKELLATSTDISEGGIALILHQAIPKMQGLVCSSRCHRPERSSMDSEVAWADVKGHVGLRFHNVPEKFAAATRTMARRPNARRRFVQRETGTAQVRRRASRLLLFLFRVFNFLSGYSTCNLLPVLHVAI